MRNLTNTSTSLSDRLRLSFLERISMVGRHASGSSRVVGEHVMRSSEPPGESEQVPIRLAPPVTQSAEPLAVRVGQRFGDYHILRAIGRGGMGEVFQAYDERLRRTIALKVLRSDSHRGQLAEVDGGLMDLVLEARTAAQLEHSRFVRVYACDVLPEVGLPYIAMEYLRGETLRSYLRRRPAVVDVLRMFRMVLEGMAYAHKRKIVHRDLKPENTFVTEDGEVKILDLGLARLSDTPESISVARAELPTVESVAAGTYEYMAPEVWQHKCGGPESDVFAIGVMLFESLAKRHPFFEPQRSLKQNVAAVCAGQAQFALLPFYVGGGLQEVIRRALSPNPQERFPSAADMLTDFLVATNGPVRSRFREHSDSAIGSWVSSRWLLVQDALRQLDPVRRRFLRVGMALLGVVTTFGLALRTAHYCVRSLKQWVSRSSASPMQMVTQSEPLAPAGMILLPGGNFHMGLTAEEVDAAEALGRNVGEPLDRLRIERATPVRLVTMTPFFLDRFETTNAEYTLWLNRNRPWLTVHSDDSTLSVQEGDTVLAQVNAPNLGIVYDKGRREFRVREGSAQKPVVSVTWDGADRYCRSNGKTLPSESQYEYSARGNARRPFPWGDQLPACGMVSFGGWKGPCKSGQATPADVGSSSADVTPEGVHDLGGNVSEWLSDVFLAPYPSCPEPCRNPSFAQATPSSEREQRVIRGSSYANTALWALGGLRSTWRADRATDTYGFRCASSADGTLHASRP